MATITASVLIQRPGIYSTPAPAPAVSTLTPTPFYNATTIARIEQGVAEWCLRFEPLVERWQPEFPGLDTNLVFAVMAKESKCDPNVIAQDRVGSVGLMQVAPLSYRPPVSELLKPHVNVYWGMRILAGSIRIAEGDLVYALAIYNCGEVGVEADRCGNYGGYVYADHVLTVWYDHFVRLRGPTLPTLTPTSSSSPTATATQTASSTPAPTLTATPTPVPTDPAPDHPITTKGKNKMEPLDALVAIAIVGLLVEAVVETVKPFWDKEQRKNLPDRIAGLAVGVGVAAVGGFDLFEAFGVPLDFIPAAAPWPGVILTGIMLSRGANFVHSLIQSAYGLAKRSLNGA
jgi:hypothetical protein